jgi:hypothetical protein
VSYVVSTAIRPLYTLHQFFLQPNIPPTLKEARVILALKAIRNNGKLSLRAIAKLYDVLELTLHSRRVGVPTRHDATPNSKKLTQSEEEAII